MPINYNIVTRPYRVYYEHTNISKMFSKTDYLKYFQKKQKPDCESLKSEELVTTMVLVMFKKPTHRDLESTGEAVPQHLVPPVVPGRRGHGVGRRQGLREETTNPYSGRNWDQTRIDISTHNEYFLNLSRVLNNGSNDNN